MCRAEAAAAYRDEAPHRVGNVDINTCHRASHFEQPRPCDQVLADGRAQIVADRSSAPFCRFRLLRPHSRPNQSRWRLRPRETTSRSARAQTRRENQVQWSQYRWRDQRRGLAGAIRYEMAGASALLAVARVRCCDRVSYGFRPPTNRSWLGAALSDPVDDIALAHLPAGSQREFVDLEEKFRHVVF